MLTDDFLWHEATQSTIGGDIHIIKFARAIEAEVSAQDTALIRQLVEALETCGDDDGYNGPSQHYETVPVEEAVAAGRARLKEAT